MRALIVFALVAVLAACNPVMGNGVPAQETRVFDEPFQHVWVENGVRVAVVVDPAAVGFTAELSTDENLLGPIQTRLRGFELTAGEDDPNPGSLIPQAILEVSGNVEGTGPGPDVTVIVPALRSASVATVRSTLDVSGIDGAAAFSVNVNNGATATVSGTVQELSVIAAGPSVVDASGLSAVNATIEVDRATVTATVTDAVVVRANGGSEITVLGSPQTVEEELRGNVTLNVP